MISPDLRARIRRLFYAEHWRVGTIADELGLHRDTVCAAIESHRFTRPGRISPSILDPYKPFVQKTLEEHPRLRSTRIYQMIRERGYSGSVVQLRRYVRKIRPRRAHEAYLRMHTLPGEQGQVDWGHFGKIQIGHAKRPLSCFVVTLGHSRAIQGLFTLDQSMESFLRGHVEAFERWGGVPRELLYDNLKSVVVERDADHIRFNPSVLELAGHYHFAPKPCAPYRPNEKGKTERAIQYIRHGFFAARTVRSVDELNGQFQRWIEDVANQRPCPGDRGGRTVAEVLKEEKERLVPLPEHRFPTDLIQAKSSGKTPFIRFDLNDYSIPHTHVRRPVKLIASPTEVRIVAEDGTELARHARSWDRGETVVEEEHHVDLARAKRAARALTGRDRLRHQCPTAEAFIAALAERDIPMQSETARLNRLLDTYGASTLDAGLRDALARGAISAASVAHMLDQEARRRNQAPPIEVVLPDDPRVRDLRVDPHDLRPYDALGAVHDESEEVQP